MELDKQLDKYLEITEKALKKVKIKEKKGEELVKLSKCYFEDAKHFKSKGELINAFAAVNYAHAFLDAGVRIGILEGKDNKLFMSE